MSMEARLQATLSSGMRHGFLETEPSAGEGQKTSQGRRAGCQNARLATVPELSHDRGGFGGGPLCPGIGK